MHTPAIGGTFPLKSSVRISLLAKPNGLVFAILRNVTISLEKEVKGYRLVNPTPYF
jgi:hypothetical protein